MKSKDLARYSILLAIAFIFSYIEHLVTIPFIFPGAKLGLANAVGLIVLYIYGRDKYFVFGLLRVLLSAVMFTGFGSTFFISLGGNILASLITVLLVSNKHISVYGISINGSIFHGLGQVIVVAIIYKTVQMIDYVVILTISGVITGLLMAFIVNIILTKIPKSYLK
jgi:heptaprenyl diphosphate synthase